MFHHPTAPCIMTNTDQFFVRICGCGVVHMNFGCAIINVSYETAIAITETLKDVSTELKRHLAPAMGNTGEPLNNVIQGHFPVAPT